MTFIMMYISPLFSFNFVADFSPEQKVAELENLLASEAPVVVMDRETKAEIVRAAIRRMERVAYVRHLSGQKVRTHSRSPWDK